MKKISALILCIGMFMASLTALAADEVTVNYNGEKMVFDAEPFIENDRTLVPMRAIFEAVGAMVTWEPNTQTVIVLRESESGLKTIALQIGCDYAFVDGEKKTFDTPAQIVDDRTFVPLRFVMEELGCEVTWEPVTYTVDIINEPAE